MLMKPSVRLRPMQVFLPSGSEHHKIEKKPRLAALAGAGLFLCELSA